MIKSTTLQAPHHIHQKLTLKLTEVFAGFHLALAKSRIMEGLIVSKSLVCEPPSQYPRVIAGSQPVFRQRNRHSGQWRQPHFGQVLRRGGLSLFKRAERVRKEPVQQDTQGQLGNRDVRRPHHRLQVQRRLVFLRPGIRQRERDPPHFSPQLRLRFDQPSPEEERGQAQPLRELGRRHVGGRWDMRRRSRLGMRFQSINPTRGRPKRRHSSGRTNRGSGNVTCYTNLGPKAVWSAS